MDVGPGRDRAAGGTSGAGADLLVVEGVMGLFDGAADGTLSSTADVAKLLAAPVVLVVDASAMSGRSPHSSTATPPSIPTVDIAGVVLNRVGSDTHETLLRDAIAPLGIPVLGALRRDDSLSWRDRHLGLVPVVEQRSEVQASLERLAHAVARCCDLDALARDRTRRATPAARGAPTSTARRCAPRIAVRRRSPFTLHVPRQHRGARSPPAPRSCPSTRSTIRRCPLASTASTSAAASLKCSSNRLPRTFHYSRTRARIGAGLTTWAECGGLLWLARSLDGHKLVGAIDTDACMTDRLTLGYVTATVRQRQPRCPGRCHSPRARVPLLPDPSPGDALQLAGRNGIHPAGFASRSLLASYLHLHLGAAPNIAERYIATARTRASI